MSVGPCYLEQWDCPEGYLPCYRDCCQRGISFCNHEEERCHRCAWRECGNLSLLPWECDEFCLKRLYQKNGMLQKAAPELHSNLVNQGYMYATYVLGVIVILLGILLIRMKVTTNRSNSQQLEVKDDESAVSADTEESRDDAETTPATLPSPPNLCNPRRESSQPLLQQAPVSTTPARVEDRLTLPPSPQASPLAEQQQQSSQQGLGHHPRHGVCRDPRLDGIAPTCDTRNDMSLRCISSSHHPQSGNSY